MFNRGMDAQSDYFGRAQDTLSPFINAGASVLPTLRSLITPGADQSATLAQTPGFQFASQYGTKAATNALSARSGASAGPLATAVSQFNNGLASNTWEKTINALMGYSQMGAGAGGALAGIAGNAGNAALGGGVTAGGNVLNAGINAGNSQAGTMTNTGNAMASGTMGTANAYMGGLNGAANAGSNALLYSKMFGNKDANGIYGDGPGSSPAGPMSVNGNVLDGYA